MYYNDYNRLNDLAPIDLTPEAPPRKKKGRGLKITALCLVFALLGGWPAAPP